VSKKIHCDACGEVAALPYLNLQRVTLVHEYDYSHVTQRQEGPDLCEACVQSIPAPVLGLLTISVSAGGGEAGYEWPRPVVTPPKADE
jgi:hypothetical protein